jgi:hypothetical protein
MTDIQVVEKLGGKIVPTENHQEWMRFRAEIPGVAIGCGYGGDTHEAARDLVKRLPTDKPVHCKLKALEPAVTTPPARRGLW